MASAALSLEYEDRADIDALQFRLRFRRGMFDEEDMRDCAAHFTRLMQQAMSAPDAPLSHMAFYPAADRSPSDNESLPLPGRPSAPVLKRSRNATRKISRWSMRGCASATVS